MRTREQITVFFLVLVGLFVGLNSAVIDQKVNLIFPEIIKAQYENCSSDYSRCNFTIWTQAAQYRLVDIDLNDETTGQIRRIGKWQEPNIANQTVFVGSDQVSMSEIARKAEQWLDSISKDANQSVLPPMRLDFSEWALCEAKTSFKLGNDSFSVCIRNAAMNILEEQSKVSHIGQLRSLFINSGYSMPITAVTVSRSRMLTTNQVEFDLIAFDSTGRLIKATFTTRLGALKLPQIDRNFINYNDLNLPNSHSVTFVDLSSTSHPLSAAKPWSPWKNATYMLNRQPKIETTLAKDIETKMRLAYIETISPIYSRGQLGSKLDASGSIAFCLSGGFMHYLDYSTKSNIRCYQEGKSHENFVGKASLSDKNSLYVPHAYQIVSLQNETHYHLVYSVKLATGDQSMRYIHCRRNEPLKPGIMPIGHDFMVDKNSGTDCESKNDLRTAPNDMIEFEHGKCHKLVSFYDFFYTVHDLNESILNKTKVNVLKNISFRINAAFALGDEIYFFTRANKLLVIKATMDTDCQELKLNMDSVRELNGQEYLYEKCMKRDEDSPLLGPFHLGYHEYAENAEDTTPRVLQKSKINFVTIGLIIGGLIITVVICFIFIKIRNRTSVPAGDRKSRRRSKSPRRIDPEMVIKTVRSKHPSSISSSRTSLEAQSRPSIRGKVSAKKLRQSKIRLNLASHSKSKSRPKSLGRQSAPKSPKSPILAKTARSPQI